jgi:hypothetical protein
MDDGTDDGMDEWKASFRPQRPLLYVILTGEDGLLLPRNKVLNWLIEAATNWYHGQNPKIPLNYSK